ncbi:MAG: efflux RND transporter permease subunit [Deltaproteobacteria bacterium]|nr:efflux RND transporter permease subunit [Deltaproteobacteria bacterium]MCB9788471.1 efflux RND transporter permease subunit [Deltaproteobacteria bacterium]
MKLPGFSVRRPIFTTMVTLMVVILGAASLTKLRIDLLPDVERPTLSIRTSYEGASPEVMEQQVTQIIEEVAATVPNVEELVSESSEGDSRVSVTFGWGTDLDTAAVELQTRLDNEINELPEDVVRPRVAKFDINSFPVVLLGIASELDPVELTTLIEDQVRYRFGRVPGVAQVDVWGGFTRELRIELDPDRLRALDLPIDQILQGVRDANLDLPAGRIERGRYEVTLRAPAYFESLDAIRHTVVARRDGAAVTVEQIGKVVDTYEKPTRIIRINQRPGVRVAIRKEANANTVQVSQAVLAEIDAINRALPQIHVVAVLNQGNFIERSIANVARSVLYGGALAVLVLLFFLRNIRSTVVIALAIPISLIATFALMYGGGMTINLMTLGGLALGVGMMVDNSIVVLENIYRRRDEEHEDPVPAAIAGTSEVGPAIVASTLTTLVIFLPLVFVQGVSGLLFKELAYVIVFALVCSLFVSLSVVPMLASRLVRTRDDAGAPGGARWVRALARRAAGATEALDRGYARTLGLALRHRGMTALSAAALLAVSLVVLLPRLGTEFMPPSDEGEVSVTGEMEVGTRLDLLDEQTRAMEAIVYPAVPEAVASVVSVRENAGELRMSLLPAGERERSNTEIAKDLRKRLEGKVPGMTFRTRAPQGQFLLERLLGGSEGLIIEVRGYELEVLEGLAAQVAEAIADVPGITDVDVSRDDGMPQERVEVNRAKAADLGLSVRQIAEALETLVAGRQAGEYRAAGNSYRILVQLAAAEKRSLGEILDLTLTAGTGEQVALRNLVSTTEDRGPLEIQRKDQQRTITVEANFADRDMGSVAADVDQRLAGIARPMGYDLYVAGNVEEQHKSSRELLLSMLLALLLVYMVMACQYESLRDPLVVMLSVPVAAVGVLLTLYLTDTTLNVQSYIGCIMLGGIVVNNAILLVDQAGQLREGGMLSRDAMMEAGRRRLRPILMTTSTTVLGLLPLALGIGEGADAQAPLARAVVGGLTASTLITLLLIPAIYTLVHPDKATAAAET